MWKYTGPRKNKAILEKENEDGSLTLPNTETYFLNKLVMVGEQQRPRVENRKSRNSPIYNCPKMTKMLLQCQEGKDAPFKEACHIKSHQRTRYMDTNKSFSNYRQKSVADKFLDQNMKR